MYRSSALIMLATPMLFLSVTMLFLAWQGKMTIVIMVVSSLSPADERLYVCS